MNIEDDYTLTRSSSGVNGPEIEDERDLRQLVRICWLYYMEGLTQKEIGERLNLSRIKVNRLLQHARSTGVVQITIQGPDTQFVAQEQALCAKYGLRDAVVVMDTENGAAQYRRLAEGASDWLMARLAPGMSVGLSLGRTISCLPEVFKPANTVDCSFTEIIAGASDHTGTFRSYNVTSRMAELVGGQASYWYAPTVVSSRELYHMLLKEAPVAEALERARHCDIALQSVGALDRDALLYKAGYLNDADLEAIKEAGVVGDVLGHFVDCDGEPVPNHLDERILSLSLEDMRQIPLNVCVAGGPAKFEVIRAVMRAGLFNVLITDAATAHALLADTD